MRTSLIGVAIVSVLIHPSAIEAQAPDGWLGTWKLNVAKSTYSPGPPPYKRATYTIEPWDDRLKMTYEMVHPRGGVTRLEWTGKLDGQEYQVQGPDELITYAYTRLADGSYEVTVRMDGRIAARSKVTLSSDGRSMITTTVGKNAAGQDVATTILYEKQ